MPYPSPLPLFAVLAAASAIPLILVSSRRPWLRETWTLLAAITGFGVVVSLLPAVLDGRHPATRIGEILPGVELALRVDAVGLLFGIVASFLWILTSIFSIGYVRTAGERDQTRYFASFAACLSATVGIAFSANLITFVVFYEILTIATYPLVVHKQTVEAIRAGRIYLAYTLSAGVLLLAGTIWIHAVAGSLDFVAGGLLAGTDASAGTVGGLFALFAIGVGVKAAIMPLHAWLPAAMVAPAPVSALLHAVAVVKSGVFGVVRVVGFVFGPALLSRHDLKVWLTVAAGITILLASVMALAQDDLKRRLAYSTVGHLSYIVLAVSLLDPTAFTGGLLHISAHATMKITLFFVAGAIYAHTRAQRVSELDGIGREMPWTMGAFAVGAVGLAGIPPINGFLSKWAIGAGAASGGHELALGILLLSGVLNAAYLFPIVHRAFLRSSPRFEGLGEAPATMLLPLLATAGLSVLLGVWPNGLVHLYDLATGASRAVFGGGL